MRKSILIFLLFITCFPCSIKAQNWTKANGINTDICITTFVENSGKIYAGGQRMWREGTIQMPKFLSEPKLFESVDCGKTWKELVFSPNENSTAIAIIISGDRIITCGRKGQSQIDWIGSTQFSDDFGKSWNEATGIPSDVSISQLRKNNANKLIAFGQRMWREGTTFYSDPKAYVSEDNGSTWSEYITITKELSSVSEAYISPNRVIVAGRKGQTQVDWIGAVYFSDNNGNNWIEAKGIPSDISVSNIIEHKGKLIAVGNKMWREGFAFLSKAKSFISEDNGANWKEYIVITDDISTAQATIIKDGFMLISGRLGQAEVDWKGGLLFSPVN